MDEHSAKSDDAVAEIVESHLLGSARLLRLKLDSEIAPLTARIIDSPPWKAGKRVRIRLDPERSFVFPASQET